MMALLLAGLGLKSWLSANASLTEKGPLVYIEAVTVAVTATVTG